ncbi:MAG: hypothetical protein WB509_00035 [Acetobacteraceae bacterium]
MAYPVRDAMVVAYQARGAACSGDSYVSGIAALAITAGSGHRLYTVWCARTDGRGAPIVTTTDGKSEPIVWAVGAEADDRLRGFRAETGNEIYTGNGPGGGMTGLRHFTTILAGAGRFYVAGDGRVFAFKLPP